MRRIPQAQFQTAPWKNGGGITHEIARHRDGDALVWRISLAEVTTDGPFSSFPGLTRILTVIDGAGLDLHGPQGVLPARPLAPVRFAGDTPVDGRLLDGPCRDVNVIFDGHCVEASVSVLRAGDMASATGVLALAGAVRVGALPLPVGDFAWTDRETVRAEADGLALLIDIAPVRCQTRWALAGAVAKGAFP